MISGKGVKEHASRLFLGREETFCMRYLVLENSYLSQNRLCKDLCLTELRTVKFQLLSGSLQLGHNLQQAATGKVRFETGS